MTGDDDVRDAIDCGVSAAGLVVLGSLAVGRADFADIRSGTLVLIGNAGPAMWRHFSTDRRDEPDPLNGWSRRTLDAIAQGLTPEFGPMRVLYPFDGPPYHPFQAWAVRAGAAFPSPIGPLIHPVYGLWHAYRGAFLLAERPHTPSPNQALHPCESCAEKPCLTTCPVDAFTAGGYDVAACVGHISGDSGAECRELGCRARRACPIGREFHYGGEQAGFHMDAFLAARRDP
ncbi:MAG: hypothetical protein GY791_14045 [Alphaproteobacteria bacterium]|nr:hypothetical protein [Alphaproteobacteria bacterium]